MIVAGERVARFVSEKIGFGLCPPYSTLGIERDQEIIAGVIFSQFEGFDVHVTVAGKGWTRSFLEAVGEYVFDQLGCGRMTVITERPEVATLAEKFGGQREGLLRSHFGPDRDGILIGILRDEFKFYNMQERLNSFTH